MGYTHYWREYDLPVSVLEWNDFCDSVQKPYDEIVVAVLTLAHHKLNLNVTSDGEGDDWKDGVSFLNQVLDSSYTVPETVAHRETD